MKKIFWKIFRKKEKPVVKYPNVNQVKQLFEKEFKGEKIGHIGNGIYHIGNGCHTGINGWRVFQNEFLKRAISELR